MLLGVPNMSGAQYEDVDEDEYGNGYDHVNGLSVCWATSQF